MAKSPRRGCLTGVPSTPKDCVAYSLDRLWEARKAAHMTQGEVAALLHIGKSNWSYVERQERPLTLALAYAACDVLHLAYRDLLPPAPEDTVYDEIVRLLKHADPAVALGLLGLLRHMATGRPFCVSPAVPA